MIYIKWLALALLDWLLLITVPIAAPIIAAFTSEMPHDQPPYTWGWLWGTYDNPPQGDEGYERNRALFPNTTTGFKGYINRVLWMFRNPLYGFAVKASIPYDPTHRMVVIGNQDVSDKYEIPGWYWVRLYDAGNKLIGFEFKGVFPYTATRDVRIRIGWKLLTSKFEKYRFAQLVTTFNPFDGYGDK